MPDYRFESPTAADATALERLDRIFQRVSAVGPRLSLTDARLLLAVAAAPGHGPVAYAAHIGVDDGAVSRRLLGLGRRDRRGGAGLGLVEPFPHETDLRAIRYRLTTRGATLVRALIDA